jgi:cytochrome c553
MMRFLLLSSLFALAGGSAAALDAAPAEIEYGRHIRPLLARHCLRCHGPREQKGELRLDRRSSALAGGLSGPALVPGKSAESLLVRYVSGLDPEIVMPPSGKRLEPGEVELLRAWIDRGAAWPEEDEEPAAAARHWAFEPPVRPEPPAVRDESWPRNAIDRFILARLEEEGLAPSPEADRHTLIRRLSLDLHGLPPAPEAVERFAADGAPDAYERLAGELLASPRYGERWAQHWLDAVRFAESHGFETNLPRDNAWAYRDYVIRALNEDRPYPRFVLEQLAGDALGEPAATGFLVGGPYDVVKSPEPALTRQQRMDELHDMINTTGTAFLGLTLGCARCHNHKFDPVAQREYYALQALLAGVEHGEREVEPPDAAERRERAERAQRELAAVEARLLRLEPLADPSPPAGAEPRRPPVHPRRNVERFAPLEAKLLRFTVLATTELEPCIDELEVYTAGEAPRNVALASLGATARSSSDYPGSDIHKLEHLNDGRYGNGRSWISAEPGRGWVEIELAEEALIDCVIWGRDREERYRDRLALDYRIETARTRGEWRLAAGSADRKPYAAGAAPSDEHLIAGLEPDAAAEVQGLLASRAELEKLAREMSAGTKIYAGSFREPAPTRLLHRGEPMEEREVVPPGGIAALGIELAIPADAPERERRLALGRWIAAPGNPLAARVAANRIWQHHFGAGIVATPGDFGRGGAPPSHPELLDWLASELAEGGFGLKALHRLIVLSSTYRQSSRAHPAGEAADAGVRLLWRFPPRRLEAEAIRDSILQASGNLDLRMGGPGYHAFEPNDNYVRVYEPKTELGPREWRRMIYQHKVRMRQDGTFGVFDCPDAGQVCPKRERSTTPLQALSLLNSSFVVEQAAFLARRLATEAEEPAAQVRRAFLLAFGREEDEEELEAALRLIEAHGLGALARALFNASEFLFIH